MSKRVFTTVAADPAWTFGDKLRMDPTVKRGSADNYKTSMRTIDIEELSSHAYLNKRERKNAPLTIAGHRVAEAAFLWLWTTGAHLLSGDALRVVRAWDFTPKQLIPWVKGELTPHAHRLTFDRHVDFTNGDSISVDCDAALKLHFGMGHYTRACSEFLILATRGTVKPLVKARNRRGIIIAPAREHSVKPEAFFDLAEAVTPGPYLELFARDRRAGWTAWGDEL